MVHQEGKLIRLKSAFSLWIMGIMNVWNASIPSFRIAILPIQCPEFNKWHPWRLGVQLVLYFSHLQDEILGLVFSNLSHACAGDQGLLQDTHRSFQVFYGIIEKIIWIFELSSLSPTFSHDIRSNQPNSLYSPVWQKWSKVSYTQSLSSFSYINIWLRISSDGILYISLVNSCH